MSAETETYVLFELANAIYAIPSTSVQHIEMLEHVTLVPNAHRAIDGVVFSRGQVIPALNLRVRFGFPRKDPDMRTRVVFAQTQQRIVGLVVDSAREFRKIPATAVRPIEQALTGVAGNYLKGLTTIDNRLILILDLDAVLNLEKDESLANSLSEIIADATESTAASAPTP
jgi:purine-binding chemotaxis protein CheW